MNFQPYFWQHFSFERSPKIHEKSFAWFSFTPRFEKYEKAIYNCTKMKISLTMPA